MGEWFESVALLGLGHSSIHELTQDDIVIPPGFVRRLGDPAAMLAR